MSIKPLEQCYLYGFVDTAYLGTKTPTEVTKELCEGGTDIIQLRAKHSSIDAVRKMAESILSITQEAGIALVINDHYQVALDLGVPYFHLGQEDFFGAGLHHVSSLIPPNSAIQAGLSSHSPDQAQRAIKAGAAYLGVGPVFATATKPEASPATLEYVRWASLHITLPWFAIGGINLETLDQVMEAGARRICVVSAILKAANIAKACQEFKRRLA